MRRFSSKAVLALALVLTLLVGLCVPAFAAGPQVSRQKLTVDGVEVACAKYNIERNNYFKLRDLAMLLNGTTSQFNVEFDAEKKEVYVTTGEAYEPVGGELEVGEDKSASCVASAWKLFVDGEEQNVAVYNIGGNNFFKLKELGDKLPADKKPAIESALQKLKDAHKSGDVAAIDAAISELNNAWQAASAQMYQQTGQAGPQAGAGAGFNGAGQQQGSANGAQQEQSGKDDIQDADFEEVK